MNPKKPLIFLTALTLFGSAETALAQSAKRNEAVGVIKLPENKKPVEKEIDYAAINLGRFKIAADEISLITFLEKGLPSYDNLPREPVEKSQLIIDAMAKLAELKSEKAVQLLIKIASFDKSVGAFNIVEHDVRNTSPQSQDTFRRQAYRLVQFNAVIALGIIGNPEAVPTVRRILMAETTPASALQYALVLGQLGSAEGLPVLVQVIQQQNRKESAAAAKAFYIITGKDFGYTENTPIRGRREKAALYSQWLNQVSGTLAIDKNKVNERMSEPAKILRYEPRTLRDYLNVASYYFDFNNKANSVEVREKLRQAGTSLNKEYMSIASDPNEDLNIRIEAMNWYFEANRSDPLNFLKNLRKDENPEIRDKAQTVMDQIAEEKAGANTQLTIRQ